MGEYVGRVQVGPTVHGLTEYWPIQVSRGNLSDHVYVRNTFGSNPDVDAATAPEDIWNGGGNVNYPASASVMNIASTSANDDAAGTGIRTVVVSGLDENWDIQQEIVALDGQTIAQTTGQYIRINRIVARTGGSGATQGTAAGTIRIFTGTATAGVPDDLTLVYRQIDANSSSSSSLSFTTPKNWEAHILYGGVQLRSGGGSGNYVGFKFLLRQMMENDGFTLKTDPLFVETLGFISSREAPFRRDLVVPFPIPEATDVKVRATEASVDNVSVSGSLNYLLVKKRQDIGTVEVV